MGVALKMIISVYLVVVIYISLLSGFPIVQQVRLSLADTVSSYSSFEPEGPGTYAFGYDVDDPETGNTQFREEERRSDGSVLGKYGWVAEDGKVYVVSYIADNRGYRATIEDSSRYRQRTIPLRKINIRNS